jgi:hypothetical protein
MPWRNAGEGPAEKFGESRPAIVRLKEGQGGKLIETRALRLAVVRRPITPQNANAGVDILVHPVLELGRKRSVPFGKCLRLEEFHV